MLVKYEVCKYQNSMCHLCNGTCNAEGSESRRIYVQGAQTWLICTITCYTIYGRPHWNINSVKWQCWHLASFSFWTLDTCWILYQAISGSWTKRKLFCQLNFRKQMTALESQTNGRVRKKGGSRNTQPRVRIGLQQPAIRWTQLTTEIHL